MYLSLNVYMNTLRNHLLLLYNTCINMSAQQFLHRHCGQHFRCQLVFCWYGNKCALGPHIEQTAAAGRDAVQNTYR